ncbi:MAG: MBL fold metallo-hydrolase [Coriobacteriia bacterium]|nr:MBL fold metallo-hydrolase [Coriobacteriia bacterium]
MSGRRLAGDTLVFESVTNSGYTSGVLIDTGPEAEAYVDHPVAHVLITHGHADHFSCACDLKRAGAFITAPREEVSLVENPEVNIRGMFSWARPSDEMVTKLFRGEGCAVDGYSDEWRDLGIDVVPLPGHTLGHSGYLTADGVLFSGDALYQRQVWKRHPLPYAIDPGLVRSSLKLLETLDFDWLVPGHGVPCLRAEALDHVAFHIDRIDTLTQTLWEQLSEPLTTEQAIAALSREAGLSDNPAQYWLAVTTVKGYLSDLLREGRAEFFVREHAGWWHALP